MKRSVLLDLIRTIAVTAVVIVHILQELGNPWGGKFGIPGFYHVTAGGAAVTVLLIISGIVLTLRYQGSDADYCGFLKKRFFRLYPAYYLILLVGILAYILRSRYGYGPLEGVTLFDIPLALSGTYAFFNKWGGPFVGTSWFLGLIMSLYLVYPLVEPQIRRRPGFVLLWTFGISVISRLLFGYFEFLHLLRALDWLLLCRIFEFSLGMYLAIKIPVDFWNQLNGNKTIERLCSYLGEMSFPLFLVHWPIFHTVKHLREYSVSTPAWIGVFWITSILASIVILEIDKRVFSPYLRRFE
jgi:peptidoglycan/LPS O-acetylase OafA/YrhL